jgi:hypothetical protein
MSPSGAGGKPRILNGNSSWTGLPLKKLSGFPIWYMKLATIPLLGTDSGKENLFKKGVRKNRL